MAALKHLGSCIDSTNEIKVKEPKILYTAGVKRLVHGYKYDEHDRKEEYTVLLVGASQCGKSTLIDCFANLFMGKDSLDIGNKFYVTKNNPVKLDSTTKEDFSIYTFCTKDNIFNFIDSPCITDKHGFIDQKRREQFELIIKEVEQCCIRINAVGFVIQNHFKAPLPRPQKNMLNFVTNLVGGDNISHIIPFITFADVNQSPVLDYLREVKIDIDKHLPFNNVGLNRTVKKLDPIVEHYWKEGLESAQKGIDIIMKLNPITLRHQLTKGPPMAHPRPHIPLTDVSKGATKEGDNTSEENSQTELLAPASSSTCKKMAEAAIKQLNAKTYFWMTDHKVAKTGFATLQHLLIEEGSVTFELPESEIITKAALKYLGASEDYGVSKTCLALIQHLIIEKGLVTLKLYESEIIAKAAVKHLGASEDYGVAKTCLPLIHHFMKKGEAQIESMVETRMIEVVISSLVTKQSSSQVDQDDGQLLQTHWEILEQSLNEDIAGWINAESNCDRFVAANGVVLIKEHLQSLPDNKTTATSLMMVACWLARWYETASHLMTADVLNPLLDIISSTKADFRVRYWSAKTIGLLAYWCNRGRITWTVQEPSLTEADEALTNAITGWDIAVDPPKEYTSFWDPLDCLTYSDSPPCEKQLNAWILANALTHNVERYCPMLEKTHPEYNKTGLVLLENVMKSSAHSGAIKKLVDITLQQYKNFKKA